MLAERGGKESALLRNCDQQNRVILWTKANIIVFYSALYEWCKLM